MYDSLVQNTKKARGVLAEGLGKRYGDLWALRDLDLDVAPGTVLGLLGHNGAGKTTAIRILTTLSSPATGRASVAGFDVAREPGAVRSRIGVAAQQATVDGLMTARANLEMVGRLYHLGRANARRRAEELLADFDLTEAGQRLVRTYSGGMPGGSTWPRRSSRARRCCSSTSRRPAWTSAAGSACGRRWRRWSRAAPPSS